MWVPDNEDVGVFVGGIVLLLQKVVFVSELQREDLFRLLLGSVQWLAWQGNMRSS